MEIGSLRGVLGGLLGGVPGAFQEPEGVSQEFRVASGTPGDPRGCKLVSEGFGRGSGALHWVSGEFLGFTGGSGDFQGVSCAFQENHGSLGGLR